MKGGGSGVKGVIGGLKIGLIDCDSHNYPNLALMKLSAWHKARGDDVEWWNGFEHYDRVYMSRVFDSTYTPEPMEPVNADEIVKGGTGYGLDNRLPDAVEHIYPDYSLYPELTKDTAYGFMTRGCPRGCAFCIVGEKEGLRSRKIADLSEWWNGQKNIVLMDPNLLACPDRLDLLKQLADSRATVDINQGFDIRLMTDEVIAAINKIKVKNIHLAWDNPNDELASKFAYFSERYRVKDYRRKTVYILTGFRSTMAENLYRIYTVRDLGYSPYVMIYDKPNAPHELILLQQWVNNPAIFKLCRRFEDFRPSDRNGEDISPDWNSW